MILWNTDQWIAIVIYRDNQEAITLAWNPQCHARTKHITIRKHFMQEKQESGKISTRQPRGR